MPKICEFENCRKYANYGEYHSKPIRCKEHKENYKLVSQLCINKSCSKIPSYNFEGLNAKYCFEHKEENMILVRGKFCEIKDCKKQPHYNYINEKRPIYCGQHKLNDMINVIINRCIFEKCSTIPTYNYLNEKVPIYCNVHKLDNMIDIKHFKCLEQNCNIRATFNFKCEKKGIYCVKHKLQDMVDVIHKMCLFDNCLVRATNGNKNDSIPLYCFIHKLNNMVNLTDKKCKANYCLGTLANSKYKGYCASCYQQLFPTDPLTLQIHSKTKEIAVRDYINLNFEGFQHDIPLWSGNCDCTNRRRIDHRKLIENTLLCIETDENQHKGYKKADEEIRYDDLYMLHGGKFIFIRFNPDKFKNKDGKNLNPMLYTRLPILKKEIENQIKRIKNEENKELLEIIHLYYDE